MKPIKSKPLIYFAFIISVTTLLIFYFVAYKNLKSTLLQTEDEKTVLKMMYQLDQLQKSLVNLELNEKPSLIIKNKSAVQKIENVHNELVNELSSLKQLCGQKNIPCNDILVLDSLFNEKLKYSHAVINFCKQGKPDSAIQLLDKEKYNLLQAELMSKHKTISDYGRNYLQVIYNARNLGSKSIFLLIGSFNIAAFVLLVFIFWRLLKLTSAKDRAISENKIFADIINNSFDSITISDIDFKLSFCNKATEDLYKRNKSEIIGKYTEDAYQSRFTKEETEERINSLKQNGYWKGESRNRDAEGNPIDLQVTVTSIKDEKGNTTGYFALHTDITSLKRTQKEVERMAASLQRAKEKLEERVNDQTALLKEVLERVKDGFVATDADFNITYANNTIDALSGENEREIEGENIFNLLVDITGEENKELIIDSFTNQEKRVFDFLHHQTERWYQVNIYPSYNGLSMYFKDVTISKKADIEVHKSKRLYEFISKTNDLILHAKNRDQIFSEICNIAVNSGGFLFAWIGVPDDTIQTIKPLTWAGYEAGYLSSTKTISTKDIPEGRGPSGKAIREGKYYYCNDIENDPAMAMWCDEALKRGYRSSIALPVKVDEKVIGIFTIYASKSFFFTEEEVQLLARVTENISYALNAFNIDEKRRDTEKKLQKVLQAVEQSSASVVITDLIGNIEYVNPAFSKLSGYTFEEAIGQNPKILKSGYTTDLEYRQLWQNITHKKEWNGIFYNRKKNGETYWESAIISPIVNDGGIITNFVAVNENITERKRLEEEQKQLITIFENTTAYIATTDLNRNFIYANKAIKDILEIGDEEDITKLNITEFRPAKVEEGILQLNKTLMETGKWVGENSYQSKSGKEIPILQVVVLHKNEQGQPTHLSTTAIDLTKIKEAEKELLRLNIELTDFSRHLLNISEIEKKEIAREIHDELGQDLTAIKFGVSWIKRHISEDKTILEGKIDDLLEDIIRTMAAFRRIHSSLHPAMLEEVGLYAAVEWLADSFTKSYAIPIKFSSNIENEPINFYKSLALYRVVQESLTNILRYSKATDVSLSLMKQEDMLILNIDDNGCGFDISGIDTKLHHGLLGMRERVYAMKGIFHISSVIGEGTFIDVKVPLS